MSEAYVTIEQANTYFSGRLHSEAWDSANEPTCQKALITATRRIDALNLRGKKVDPDQVLQFPRAGQSEVPKAVLDATCEEALALLSQSDEDRQRLAWQRQGVRSVSIGDASESYAADRAEWSEAESALASAEALQLLAPWIVGVRPQRAGYIV